MQVAWAACEILCLQRHVLLDETFGLGNFLLQIRHMPFNRGADSSEGFAGTEPIALHRAHLDQRVQSPHQALEFLHLRC